MMESISHSRNSSSLIILTRRSLPSSTTIHNQVFLPKRHPRRRRSRRQARRERENESMQAAKRVAESPPKKWEDMSLSEKAVELYVGEKGALFWLNKFAYASIFIMIGGWIMFRFVGLALNLDGPLLAPSDVFK